MKIVGIVTVVVVIFLAVFLLLSHPSQKSIAPSPIVPSNIVSPIKEAKSVFTQFVDQSLPITWQQETMTTNMYQEKTISGTKQEGKVTYKDAYLHVLANASYLQSNGWQQDNNIAADGPMGSQWGYTKNDGGKKQVLIFSYTNLSFVPPPNQTTCPCNFNVSVFLSDPF